MVFLVILLLLLLPQVHPQVLFSSDLYSSRCFANEGTGKCVSIYQCPPILMAVQTNLKLALNRLQLCITHNSKSRYVVCCLPPETDPFRPLQPPECGLSIPHRIRGGSNAVLGEYPWMAALFYSRGGRPLPQPSCGGTLISKRYVLTAGHCVDQHYLKGLKLVSVRLGEYNLRTDIDTESTPNGGVIQAPPVQDIAIQRFILHPDYITKENLPFNDIALVRLQREVLFSDYIIPVCLPIDGDSFIDDSHLNGTFLEVAGWGITDPEIQNSRPEVLQKMEVEVMDKQICQNAIGNSRIKDYHICAGGEEGVDSCVGDSGGPLMRVHIKTAVVCQVGVVSFGRHPCGSKDVPGVYTNVAHFLPWITKHLERG